jgi:hypothetical protein
MDESRSAPRFISSGFVRAALPVGFVLVFGGCGRETVNHAASPKPAAHAVGYQPACEALEHPDRELPPP